MARKAREKSSTGVYAVILRGNGDVFGSADMQGAFRDAAEEYLGEGLMGLRFTGSRADMLIRESDRGISLDMKPLITSFARTYNRANETDGKVFADRFKSVPVEDAELERECVSYLMGGEPAAPYIAGAAPARPIQRAARPKPEKQTEPAKPKRKNLPSWLL